MNRGFNPPSTPNRGFSLATHAVELIPGVTLDRTRLPSAIVYVKQSAKWLRAFYRFCQTRDVGVTVWGPADPETGKRAKVVRVGGPRTELAESNGQSVRRVVDESVCGDVNAWEVTGSAEAVAELVSHACVDKWHKIVSCRVPVQASGTGTEREKPTKPKAKHQRDATTRAVVVGNELTDEGERVAKWDLRRPAADGTAN